MPLDPLSDAKIVESWGKNAQPWVAAIREEQIESRTLITNRAIVEAVLSRSPHTVLDIGCGEGWLTRELTAHGLHVTGIDGVPALIEEAERTGEGQYLVLTYEALAEGAYKGSVDAIVCNFSLLGKESVEGLLQSATAMLNPKGVFIIQTLHPLLACGEAPYRDGWRAGTWAGFSDAFTDPPPWYFRTLESWILLFQKSGFQLLELREPLHPEHGKRVTVIFIFGLSE